MSAYASLPGSFLPPFFAFGGTSPTKQDDESSECGASSHREDQRQNQVSMQERQNSTSSCQKSSCSSKTPGCHRVPSGCSLPDLNTLEFASSDSAKTTRATSPASEVIIAINNARVDTVKLIQSLTTRGSNIARRTANFISRTSEAEDKATSACSTTETDSQTVQSKPSLCYEGSDSEDDDDMSFYDYDDDFTNYERDKNQSTEEPSICSMPSQDEDAIQFELFINFHGREYKAFRAFSTFVQLRNDLLRDRTVPSTVSIPELPSLSSENYERHSSITGFHALARSGFAMLQATAKMYCPEMERWLRHVVEAVPASPILNRFLWEPLASSTASWHPDDSTVDDGNGVSCAKPPQPRTKTRQNNVVPSLKYRSKSYNTSLSSITELLDES